MVPRRSMAFFSSGSSLSFSALTMASRDLVLQREDVVEIAVVALGPDVIAVDAVDQLGGDAHAAAGFAHAAFQHVADLQLPRDLRDIDILALEWKAVLRAITDKRRDLGQIGDDVFADAVAEIFLLGIAAHIGEGQDRDGRHALRRRVRGDWGLPGYGDGLRIVGGQFVAGPRW